MNQTLEEAESYVNLTVTHMKSNANILKALKELLGGIEMTFSQLFSQVQHMALKFQEAVNAHKSFENELLTIYYQSLCGFLLNLSQSYKNVAQNIGQEILESYNSFVDQYREKNRANAKDLIEQFQELNINRTRVKLEQTKYFD